MCKECGRSPCHPCCPNAPDPEPVYSCEKCEEGIYEGDDYYEIEGKTYCADCIDMCRSTAEYQEPAFDEDLAFERWREEHEEEYKRVFGKE